MSSVKNLRLFSILVATSGPHKYSKTNTHMHTDTRAQTRTRTDTHAHTRAQTHACRHTDTHAHRHTRTQTHTHTDTHAHRHTRTRIEMNMCGMNCSCLVNSTREEDLWLQCVSQADVFCYDLSGLMLWFLSVTVDFSDHVCLKRTQIFSVGLRWDCLLFSSPVLWRVPSFLHFYNAFILNTQP